MKKLTLILYACSIMLNGCVLNSQVVEVAGVRTYDGLSATYPFESSAFAQDAADELARRYPPARTDVTLVRSEGIFADALEFRLRSHGFGVGSSGLAIGYMLDSIQEENTAYAQILVADGSRFGFVRSLGTPGTPAPVQGGAQPLNIPAPKTTAIFSELLESASIVESVPTGQQQSILRLAVLKSLPSGWRYTIPDNSKREVPVSWPMELDAKNRWRDRISFQAGQAGCEARFDDVARRVTVATLPETSQPAASPARLSPVVQPVAASSAAVTQALNEVGLPAATALPVSPAPVPSLHSPVLSMEVFSAPSNSESEWALVPGSLENQLKEWANRANWQLLWKAEHDIELQAHAILRGSFEEAVTKVFRGVNLQGNALRITFYSTNNVLEVQED